MTHTFAFLDVSAECIAEIKDKMEKYGYGRAVQIHDGAVVIDMYGIALREERLPDDGNGEPAPDTNFESAGHPKER